MTLYAVIKRASQLATVTAAAAALVAFGPPSLAPAWPAAREAAGAALQRGLLAVEVVEAATAPTAAGAPSAAAATPCGEGIGDLREAAASKAACEACGGSLDFDASAGMGFSHCQLVQSVAERGNAVEAAVETITLSAKLFSDSKCTTAHQFKTITNARPARQLQLLQGGPRLGALRVRGGLKAALPPLLGEEDLRRRSFGGGHNQLQLLRRAGDARQRAVDLDGWLRAEVGVADYLYRCYYTHDTYSYNHYHQPVPWVRSLIRGGGSPPHDCPDTPRRMRQHFYFSTTCLAASSLGYDGVTHTPAVVVRVCSQPRARCTLRSCLPPFSAPLGVQLRVQKTNLSSTVNLRTNIINALLKHDLNSKGWNSQAHRGSPGKFESSNLSRDNVSREIGRTSAWEFYRASPRRRARRLRDKWRDFPLASSGRNSRFIKGGCSGNRV